MLNNFDDKFWEEYEDTYKEYYGLRITAGYSEDEAVKIATEKAEKAAEKAKYAWFVLYVLNGTNSPLIWYYRYYGMIGDYVVLSTYIDSGFGAYGGFTVGGYEFDYPNALKYNELPLKFRKKAKLISNTNEIFELIKNDNGLKIFCGSLYMLGNTFANYKLD